MGFDEHRIQLEKQEGGPVGFDAVFVDTHATKECKKRLRKGEINVNDLDKLEFVTDRSKQSFASFTRELEKLYGKDRNQHPLPKDRDDLAVWERVHPNSRGRQIFGVGSSDPHFVVTGTPSSTACGSRSYSDVRQSQEVQDVRAELEKEREARQNLENRLGQMKQEQEREQAEREEWEQKLQQQFEEIMKKLADK